METPTKLTRSAAATQYGCEEFGRLRKVLLHRPDRGLEVVRPDNHHGLLYDAVPDIPRVVAEHDGYRRLLSDHDVEVVELSDHLSDGAEMISRLPNLTYLHDVAVITRRGAILSSMAPGSRRGEEVLVREALKAMGIPILIEFDDPRHSFEGCLLLSPRTLLVADTERHNRAAIDWFIPRALEHFEEVLDVTIPKARRFMHPDTIYNRIDHDLALAYLPAFRRTVLHTRRGRSEVDFADFMAGRGVEIVNVSDAEQAALACSFVPLEGRVILHYDDALSPATQRTLARKGVKVIPHHPDALHAGGGSLRCLTLRLFREA